MVDISGSPCKDYSEANNGKLKEDGKHFQSMAIWAHLLRTEHVPVIIHENVPGFPADSLLELLGDAYGRKPGAHQNSRQSAYAPPHRPS